MLRFANAQFERSAKAADGNNKGEHIDAARRHPLYREQHALVVAQLPFELAHVWQWFMQLNRKRQSGMAVNPLSSIDILAWQLRHRIRLTAWEEELLDQLDASFIAHQGSEH